MQRLLNRADWRAAAARDALLDFCAARFGDDAGVMVLDETGFLKKGDASVGVQRQYSGTAGKLENCQVAVFLSYQSRAGHVLLDRALYLPARWCTDVARRQRARVPRTVQFHTKPQLAARLLRRAWAHHVPCAWVTGDEIYGDDPALRDAIAAAGRRYVLAVAGNTPVWATRPATVAPGPARGGRGGPARTRTRLAPGAPPVSTVKAVSGAWAAARWRRLAVTQGEKGPIEYDWAAARVVDSRHRVPVDEVWLLARRSVADPTDVAWYLSNAPADATLAQLARVAATRFTVEQCFEEAKDDVGLDHYEVRTWPAWHRHITLAMMALAWLASVRLALETTDPTVAATAGKKGGPRRARNSQGGRSRKPGG
jgi:SRSO17 transposase